jgi:hypothetical protein
MMGEIRDVIGTLNHSYSDIFGIRNLDGKIVIGQVKN